MAGNSIPVRQANNVIESRIDGEFKGWEGETVYKLANGQLWQQSSYKYQYKYAFMPQVIVYEGGSGYKMLMSRDDGKCQEGKIRPKKSKRG